MKLDEAGLEHLALQMIEKVLTEPEPIEVSIRDSDWHTTAGYIVGVIEMMKELKEVLNNNGTDQ